MVEATPESRERYVDLLRVVSIGVVVLGHWTMAVLGYSDGTFTGRNLLDIDPSVHIFTWIFQVMPLFFICGGYANAASWESARRRGQRYAGWLRVRSARLLRPALWFIAFWTVPPILAVLMGFSEGVVRAGGREVALPLWFLAIYLVTVAAAPPLLAAHRRWGVWVLVGLASVALVVDVARFGLDVDLIGGANFGFVWLGVLELGFLWRDGALTARRSTPWLMALSGLIALAVLTLAFDYPVSMVGLTHWVRNNTTPPSIALFALAAWQCGAVLIFRPAASKWLRRPRVWGVVVAANSMVMTFYLWNMTAVVLAALILYPTGIAPQPEALSGGWWLWRIAWMGACGVCLLPFLFAFRWAERPAPPPAAPKAGWVGATACVGGLVIAAVGLGVLAAQAFPLPSTPGPAIGVVAVVVGAIALRVDPVGPLRRRAID
jgi:hypothetical protein